jgi:hypothetical protein
LEALANRHLVDLQFVDDPLRAATSEIVHVSDMRQIDVMSSAGGRKIDVVKKFGGGKKIAVVKKIIAWQIKSVSAKRKEDGSRCAVAWRRSTGEKQLATRSVWPMSGCLLRSDALKTKPEQGTGGHTDRRCCLVPPTTILLQGADPLM